MEKITKLLARKQPHFNKISPACSANDALCRMNSQRTDYLIVMDENDFFLGLLTEHDVASKTIFANQALAKTRVNEMMNTRLPVADAGDTVEECMRLMIRYNVRHLPVFNNLDFLGIVSSDDILGVVVSHRKDVFDLEEKAISMAGY